MTAFRRMLSVVICLLGILTSSLWATDYYVDATAGDDSAAGTSEGAAWRTIAKINASTFSPGDTIRFKCGEVWREEMTVPSSGSAGSPITFTKYGTGANPIVKKTSLYNGWWESSIFINGGFEMLDSGTVDDETDDDFTNWTESAGTGGYIRAVSDTPSHGTVVKMHRASAETYLRYTLTLSPNKDYYMDLSGKLVSGSSGLRVRILDANNNLYLQDDTTWGAAYNELEAFSMTSSSWATKAVQFHANANTTHLRVDMMVANDNTTVCIDNLYIAQGATRPAARIWTQYYGTVAPFSIIDGGQRIPKDRDTTYPPVDLKAGYWSLLSGYMYYRKDSGVPVAMEVGARSRGIVIDSKNYITVDGIDVFGGSAVSAGKLIDIDGTAAHIIIKNLEISCNDAIGIRSGPATSDVTYDNLHVHDNANTGAYINSTTGLVTNCRVHDNGRVIGDAGDRGGIGSYQGGGITFSYNEVYRNGQDDANCDMEISVVQPTAAVTIVGNYVHESISGGIQVAEGGSGSVISYNIVDGFGETTYDGDGISPGKFSGIRVGTPAIMITGVKIYNNIITGGAQAVSTTHAGIMMRYTGGACEIKNNLFLNNTSKDVHIYADVVTTSFDFSNNLYYKSDFTGNWFWKSNLWLCDTLTEWVAVSGETGALDSDPMVVDEANNDFRLSAGSPAINAGVDVGLTRDYDGCDVPLGGAPDIGAFEFGLRGDFDFDGDVDADDIDLLLAEVNAGTNDTDFDLAGDPLLVNQADLDEHIQVILATEYGDANLDHKVDLHDLSLVASRWETINPGGWADGNFNGDSWVGLDDLSILASNWGWVAP